MLIISDKPCWSNWRIHLQISDVQKPWVHFHNAPLLQYFIWSLEKSESVNQISKSIKLVNFLADSLHSISCSSSFCAFSYAPLLEIYLIFIALWAFYVQKLNFTLESLFQFISLPLKSWNCALETLLSKFYLQTFCNRSCRSLLI